MKNIYAIIIVLVLLGLSAFFLYKGVKKEEKSEERKLGKHFEAIYSELDKNNKASQVLKAYNDFSTTPVISPAIKNLLTDLLKTLCNREYNENLKLKSSQYLKDCGINDPNIIQDIVEPLIGENFLLFIYITITSKLNENEKNDYLQALQLNIGKNMFEIEGNNITIKNEKDYEVVKDYMNKTMNKYDFAKALYRFAKDSFTNKEKCKNIMKKRSNINEADLKICDYFEKIYEANKNLCDYIVN